jgi:hypothetical protein
MLEYLSVFTVVRRISASITVIVVIMLPPIDHHLPEEKLGQVFFVCQVNCPLHVPFLPELGQKIMDNLLEDLLMFMAILAVNVGTVVMVTTFIVFFCLSSRCVVCTLKRMNYRQHK